MEQQGTPKKRPLCVREKSGVATQPLHIVGYGQREFVDINGGLSMESTSNSVLYTNSRAKVQIMFDQTCVAERDGRAFEQLLNDVGANFLGGKSAAIFHCVSITDRNRVSGFNYESIKKSNLTPHCDNSLLERIFAKFVESRNPDQVIHLSVHGLIDSKTINLLVSTKSASKLTQTAKVHLPHDPHLISITPYLPPSKASRASNIVKENASSTLTEQKAFQNSLLKALKRFRKLLRKEDKDFSKAGIVVQLSIIENSTPPVAKNSFSLFEFIGRGQNGAALNVCDYLGRLSDSGSSLPHNSLSTLLQRKVVEDTQCLFFYQFPQKDMQRGFLFLVSLLSRLRKSAVQIQQLENTVEKRKVSGRSQSTISHHAKVQISKVNPSMGKMNSFISERVNPESSYSTTHRKTVIISDYEESIKPSRPRKNKTPTRAGPTDPRFKMFAALRSLKNPNDQYSKIYGCTPKRTLS